MRTRSDVSGGSRPDSVRQANHTHGGTAVVAVHVVPRASRNEIVGVQGDTLKVKVTAPPVKGKANEALVKLLAKTLGVKKSQIEVVSGREARRKMVRIEGVDKNVVLDQIRQCSQRS